MEAQELKEKLTDFLNDNQVSVENLANGDYDDAFKDLIQATFGEHTAIFYGKRTKGGGDWDGAQTVFHFKEHNVYIAINGWYGSESGCNFDDSDLTIVEPVEVVSTVYREVKNQTSQAW